MCKGENKEIIPYGSDEGENEENYSDDEEEMAQLGVDPIELMLGLPEGLTIYYLPLQYEFSVMVTGAFLAGLPETGFNIRSYTTRPLLINVSQFCISYSFNPHYLIYFVASMWILSSEIWGFLKFLTMNFDLDGPQMRHNAI